MKEVKPLTCFFSAIKSDHRIGATHISIYAVLIHFYNLNGFANPIKVTRASIMETAKISGVATYHKCMRDLAQFGYIQYMPSYNPALGSQVCLLKI